MRLSLPFFSRLFWPSHALLRLILGMSALALLGACQQEPDYRLVAAPTPEGGTTILKAPKKQTKNDVVANIKTALEGNEEIQFWPRQPCVVSFSCPVPKEKASLRDVVWYGASINPDVAASVARERVAQADARAALYALGPTPSLLLDADYLSLEIAQPIFSAGSLKVALASARKRVEIAAADVRLAQLDVALSIINAYANWQSAYLTESVWRDALSAQQLIVDSLERRVEAGLSNENELLQARTLLISTKREIFSVSVNRERALGDLSVAVGASIPEEIMIAGIETEAPPVMPQDDATLATFDTNPFLIKAKATIEKAEIDLRGARLRSWPTISYAFRLRDPAPGSASHLKSGQDDFLRARSDFGASLSVRARVESAQSNLEAAQENLSSNRRRLIGSLEQDYVLLASAIENSTVAKELVFTAQEILTSNQRQFSSGTKRWNDVMQAILELANTKTLEIDAASAAFLSAWRINISAKTPYGL